MAAKKATSTAVNVTAAPAIRERRVYLNGHFSGIHKFPATGVLNDIVYQSLLKKMSKEEADKVTITVLKMPADGSKVPANYVFKKDRRSEPAPVTKKIEEKKVDELVAAASK